MSSRWNFNSVDARNKAETKLNITFIVVVSLTVAKKKFNLFINCCFFFPITFFFFFWSLLFYRIFFQFWKKWIERLIKHMKNEKVKKMVTTKMSSCIHFIRKILYSSLSFRFVFCFLVALLFFHCLFIVLPVFLFFLIQFFSLFSFAFLNSFHLIFYIGNFFFFLLSEFK